MKLLRSAQRPTGALMVWDMPLDCTEDARADEVDADEAEPVGLGEKPGGGGTSEVEEVEEVEEEERGEARFSALCCESASVG